MDNETFNQNLQREQYLEKPLPASPEAERVILGAILLDNNIIHEIADYLKPEDYYSPLHRKIYRAMLVLAYGDSNPKPIDPILIGEVLKEDSSIETIGGVATITNLTYGLPHFSDIKDYAVIVKGKAEIRNRIKVCNQIISECLSEADSPERTLASTEKLFTDSAELIGKIDSSNVATGSEAVDAFNQKVLAWKKGKTTAIPTPFSTQNKRLKEKGLIFGDLSITCARPSDGKTTLGFQEVYQIAKFYKIPTLCISLEMNKEELIEKAIAFESGVPNYLINEELFNSTKPEDLARVEAIRQAEREIKKVPFFIDDESQTLSQISATINEYVTNHGVLYVFVDYLQEIINDISDPRETRDSSLGYICTHLKKLARRKTKRKPKCHINLAVQLKKTADGSKPPTLGDLRESGRIEQVADLIRALYGKKPEGEVVLRQMKMIALKQRKGRLGWIIDMTLHGDWQCFLDSVMMKDNEVRIRQSLEVFGSDSEF